MILEHLEVASLPENTLHDWCDTDIYDLVFTKRDRRNEAGAKT